MTRSRIRTTGPLGTAVVLTFLLGSLSAPLRPCLSHQGHDHHGPPADLAHPQAAEVAHHHERHETPHGGPASSAEQDPVLDAGAPADGEAPAGCECLGLCQLETSPFLPIGAAAPHAVAPTPDVASRRSLGDGPVHAASHAVPLARGPPPLA